MVGRSAKVAENDRVRKKRELDGLLARDRELDMLFERLYEDNVSGKIDDARFANMSKRYEQEQGENAGRIKALRLELKKLEDKRMDVDTFLETVRRYTCLLYTSVPAAFFILPEKWRRPGKKAGDRIFPIPCFFFLR